MVIAAASFWGLSGTVAQKLFQEEGFTPEWLVVVRMIVAGVLLLGLGAVRGNRAQVVSVWKDSTMRIRMVVFGILGMLGVQYTFFTAIQAGNAASAALLQYLAPLFVMLFQAWKSSRLPSGRELVAVAVALVGTFLLVTDGSVEQLSISTAAILWGIASAVALAFYTIYPKGMLQAFDSSVIVGWGMVIGGVALAVVNRPWAVTGMHWSWVTILFLAFIILFGTLLAFYLYVESLRYISPTETSLIAILEPLVAVLASVLWLRVPFGLFEGIGAVCILVTVVMLSIPEKWGKSGVRKQNVEDMGG